MSLKFVYALAGSVLWAVLVSHCGSNINQSSILAELNLRKNPFSIVGSVTFTSRKTVSFLWNFIQSKLWRSVSIIFLSCFIEAIQNDTFYNFWVYNLNYIMNKNPANLKNRSTYPRFWKRVLLGCLCEVVIKSFVGLNVVSCDKSSRGFVGVKK